MADANRQYWNQQFKILQNTWPKPNHFEKCIEICLMLHGMVHEKTLEQECPVSFEDEMWAALDNDYFRKVHHENQSIVWKIWHSSRIEDMTMNVLVAGQEQVFDRNDWYSKMKVKAKDTGNAMNEEEIDEMSKTVDIKVLRDYRNEVAKQTRKVIKALLPQDLKRKVDPARLKQLLEDGSIAEKAAGVADYWGSKTFSGLLLMPATRHLLVHINESMRLIEKK